MKSLQEIRIDIVRMGKEIRVNPFFEEKFQELCKYLGTEFGAPEFHLEDYEVNQIDNSRFECEILKCAICHAFKIKYSPGNPWFRVFQIFKSEDSNGYHGSISDKIITKYDINFSGVIGYEIYNLLSISEEQLEFIGSFKNKYQVFKEDLEKIKSKCFPIIVEE